VESRYRELNFFLETRLGFGTVKIWISCRTQTSTLFIVRIEFCPDSLLRVSKPESHKNRNELNFLGHMPQLDSESVLLGLGCRKNGYRTTMLADRLDTSTKDEDDQAGRVCLSEPVR
jgi:hypothetical protein